MLPLGSTRGAPAIEVRGLVRLFGERRAVDGLDLELERGQSLGLLGPNGAGKTTTIRVLCTLCAPSAGSVRVLGLDPQREAAELRARIGVVPQELALYDPLHADENLEFHGRMHGLSGAHLERRVDWALELAGLRERRRDPVSTYSGGMKRRLNLVTALLHEPELVFMDEPTVGVDPQSRNHVFEMVERLHADGLTLVYTTHQLGEVERLCDRIAILDTGRAVAQGTLEELRRGQAHSAVQRYARVELDEGTRTRLEAAGITFRVEEELPDLEAVFLALTGRALRDEE
ncbi:MAG: ABC transporter ATP-binding protein [Planctomycetes bacterium]|nr:ABC transporter ATP-binding protein [Planctomycetota bacterium]